MKTTHVTPGKGDKEKHRHLVGISWFLPSVKLFYRLSSQTLNEMCRRANAISSAILLNQVCAESKRLTSTLASIESSM